MKTLISIFILAYAAGALDAEYHVAVTGNDASDGSKARPLKTIQAAANLAQPGDVITVHEGTYRERVNPPRGGTSDKNGITYQAAPGEKVIITGSEPVKGWQKVTNDTWKVALPTSYFGEFNPFDDKVRGEWCSPTGRHTGMVYREGEWFAESLALGPVLAPAGKAALWFAKVGGADTGAHLFAIKSISINGHRVASDTFSSKNGELHATACADGDGRCVGWIAADSWLSYAQVDFGSQAEVAGGQIEITAGALQDGGVVELRLDGADGDLLGRCRVTHTGDWQKWATFTAPIKPIRGRRTLWLVFKPHQTEEATTIWAQFPGMNPNEANVEINKRQAVFYPSKPGINYITVRGFELCQAATPWAGAMSEQIALVGTHWSKGWIIENNHIHHSMCSGVTLGRYELPKGEMPPVTASGFVKSIELALRDGWSKEKVGSHIVRNNHIHHCEKSAIHGSLGSPFSGISGNDIHDIAVRDWVCGPDTAGIKFLGGVDMVIRDNHIYRCGGVAGIWLDWMAQGAVVTGNLLHDNRDSDIYFEMQHGPVTFANNLLLSGQALTVNAKGLAFAHNLIAGRVHHCTTDEKPPRQTPFHPAHALTIAGLSSAGTGDHRFYNNLFANHWNGSALNNVTLPCFASGNVFVGPAQAFTFDPAPLLKPQFNPQFTLKQETDGWHLSFNTAPAWRAEAQCRPVTTALLGNARIPNLPYENADGTPLKIDTDYFGRLRNPQNPFPGPFEISKAGTRTIKVWPKP